MSVRSAVVRLAGLLVVVLGVTLITFAISHLVPGDPAQLLAGPRAGPDAVERLRAELGLDQPLPVQYGRYLAGLVQGDLGRSIVTGRPVLDDLAKVFPATLELVLASLALSVGFGVAIGAAAAVKRDSLFDAFARLVAAASVSIPSFWLALVLLLVFYGLLGIAPVDGRIGVALDPPRGPTGLYLLDSLLHGDGRAFLDALAHLALPALTLALVSVGGVIRIIRASMIEVLGEDYIRTAVAAGHSRTAVIVGHALRNALIPFVTLLGLEAAALLFGSVVVETVFVWPGAGSYVLGAIQALDFPVIMGFTVVVSIAYVLINGAVDLLYRALDPRIGEAS